MSKAKPTDDRAADDAGLDANAMESIGRALKAHYDDLVKAPLPERLRQLIGSLDADETAPKGGTDAPG